MRIFATILLFGQLLMATTLHYININGVQVPLVYEHDTRLPLVSTQLVFRNSGSLQDGDLNGLASMSAKLLNEGTLKRGNEGFAEALDAKAIHLSTHVGSETLVMEMGSLKEEFAEATTLLHELLQAPNYNDKVLQKIKTTTAGSLQRKESDYDYVANVALKSLIFKGTPLANPSVGTLESIKKIKLKEVESFVSSHLVLERLILVVGGDISLEEATQYFQEILKEMPKGEAGTLVFYPTIPKPKSETLIRKTEQAYIYFASPYAMKVGDEDYYKARVATFILGTGGFGSRLMEEIRVKRGLAYSAYARVSVNQSHSYMMGYLQTKLESLDEAQKTVNEVIAKFVKEGVTQEELDQTKRFLLGSEPLRTETLSQRLSRSYMEFYKGETLGSSVKELDMIRDLTLNDLNSYIKQHKEILELSYAIVKD